VRGAEKCEPLKWTLIDVPGAQPRGRWGAGMVLDPADNLYIIGGNTFDSVAREFRVLSDIFIFQVWAFSREYRALLQENGNVVWQYRAFPA